MGRQPTARGPNAARQGILPGLRLFIVIRPATFFSFFSGRYAAINRRNDSHLLAKTFVCGLRHRFVQKKTRISGEDLFFVFFFWSSPSTRPKKGLNFRGLRHRFVRKEV